MLSYGSHAAPALPHVAFSSALGPHGSAQRDAPCGWLLGDPAVPTLVVEKPVLSPLNHLVRSVENPLTEDPRPIS